MLQLAIGMIVVGLFCLLAATQIEQSGQFTTRDFMGLIGLPAAGIMLCGLGGVLLFVFRR